MQVGDVIEILDGANKGKQCVIIEESETEFTIATPTGIILRSGEKKTTGAIEKARVRLIRPGNNMPNLRIIK